MSNPSTPSTTVISIRLKNLLKKLGHGGRASVDLVSKTLHNVISDSHFFLIYQVLETELKTSKNVETAIRDSFRKTDDLVGQNKSDSRYFSP
jgi:hypothetical protein